jgi:His-Xaa-Ser system protein HxsD
MLADSENRSESGLGFVLEDRSISFDLDETVYPLDAIYGASYVFLDRCLVFLSRPADRVVRVRLTSREAATAPELELLAGEFGNELLSQLVRLRLSATTARIREYYTAAALRAAASSPSIDDLLSELEAEELAEDPLEIMVPWEEKHGASQSAADPKKAGG